MLRLQHLLLLALFAVCVFLISYLLTHDGADTRSKLPLKGSFGQSFEPRLGGIESRLVTLENFGRKDNYAALRSSNSAMANRESLQELSATINETIRSLHSDNKEMHAELAAMKARLDELSRQIVAPQSESIVAPSAESNRSSSAESTRKGLLQCDGAPLDSEVVYWKVVPGDLDYESPITPHHHEHGEKFLTFNYEISGFNNVRMTVECMIVVAHAMGRTLVIPPNFETEDFIRGDHNEWYDMGFEDLMSMKLVRTQRGFHSMTMEEFLRTQGLAGKLKGFIPRDTLMKGDELKDYLLRVADFVPYNKTTWQIQFLAFPDQVGDFRMNNYLSHIPRNASERLWLFYGADENGRNPLFYDETMRQAKTIHLTNDYSARLFQHFYSFAFFADPDMASFYKRFIRDFVRYDDPIFCHAARLIAAIREESMMLNPENNGDYYALHIRRGDIHADEVKVSTKQILDNLRFSDNSSIIPRGAYVYIATDDPDGVCKGCRYQISRNCPKFNDSDPNLVPPYGCLSEADASWTAFIEAGWHIRFFRDFGPQKGVNQHMYSMIESVICSRAKRFSGTLFSTFTGYIHRLRGYHGLGEESYLHAPTGRTMYLRDPRSVGSGWMREFRAGWTNDNGELI